MRDKKHYLKFILLFSLIFVALPISLFFVKFAKAQDGSTTFPVDEAGISAYVKVDNVEDIDLRAAANVCHSIEKLEPSYVICLLEIENRVGLNYPHIYIGADGWIVAYYLKDQESSRIMQWKSYRKGEEIKSTILKDAIDHLCQRVGLTYSSQIKYFHFAFPEANKMTLIAESQGGYRKDEFYVNVPGTIYEASFSIWLINPCCSGFRCRVLELKIDENLVYKSKGLGCWYTCSGPFIEYGFYDLNIFVPEITHHVTFFPDGCKTANATLLIYKD